jgi:uncharacterized membrane protein YcaP (DUF421 family)/ribosomal protein L40E
MKPIGESTGMDWHRLLVGNAPWAFLLEVVVRILFVYLVLVLVVRLLGKRLSGHIGNLDLAVMLAIGAIVSVPFQDPMRGVLPGVVLLCCLLVLQRGVSALGVRSRRIEDMTQKHSTVLVADGVLVLEQMRAAGISPRQLFSVLRGQGLRHLGQARRVYLEAYGLFSVFRQQPAKPGLSVAPAWDQALDEGWERAADSVACRRCGAVERSRDPSEAQVPCRRCGANAWSPTLTGD